MLLITALFLILTEAVYEALYDSGHKTTSGIIEFVYRAIVTVMVLSYVGMCYIDFSARDYPSFWYMIGGYVLLRFALFDISYNLIRGLSPFYIGSTKLIDKAWKWFFIWSGIPVVHFFAMFKFIALCIGVAWLLK
jgi:hypothetical protein